MDMKSLIQRMTDIENTKTTLNESTITECGMEGPMAPTTPPPSISINLSAQGIDQIQDLLGLMKNAGLSQAEPVGAISLPMRQDMERLRGIVDDDVNMEADEAYSDVITDDEDLEEGMDPKALMGQIRKMAKGVETSTDEREHRIFASQVESDLIDLFQYYNQVQRDTEKQEIVRNLIRQNKKAQQQTDRRNANNIVNVLWDLMNANESFANEPDEEYQDHNFMTKDLAGGINKPKRMFKASQRGDNAMAVETIKTQLYKALAEKKAKPDFLDMDKDGNKKEPMKKAIADKKKKGPVKEGAHKDEMLKDAAKMSKAAFIKKYGKENADTWETTNESKSPVKEVSDQERLSARKVQRDAQTARHGTERKPGESMAAYLARADKLKKKKSQKTSEAEFKAPTHELDDTARKAMNIAQMIKRKINSGEKMDDMDYNQMAELGHVLSRFGTNFGPQSMKDVFNHMKQYTDDRNEYGTGYPEFNVERFKELLAMAKSTGESMVGEISKDLARNYYRKASKDIGDQARSADDFRGGSSDLKGRLNRNYNRDGSRTTDADREKDRDTISKYDAGRKKAERKIKNRATGIGNAAKRM